MQDFIRLLLGLPKGDLTLDTIKELKRDYSRKNHLKDVPSNVEIFSAYQDMVHNGLISANKQLELVLKKRAIRSESGIVPIQVLTKPFWCPGKCIFCPNDATMPKSYINTEPGAMRALLNNFDPYKQVYNRLLSLTLTGHDTDKIEMIVLGGTWDVYPKEYKIRFIKGLYDACNTFSEFKQKYLNKEIDPRSAKYCIDDLHFTYPKNIEESITINETAQQRIIGLTIETRPEYVTDENCQLWRSLGITRIEMGIQSMFDDVLDANKRGHSVQQVRQAMHKLRQYAFKISTHFMTGLYGSTAEKDIKSFEMAYNDPWIKPDEIKFYPTGVVPNTELYTLYKKGDYKLMDIPTLKSVIKKVLLEYIPPYTRIKRLIRDIPADEIVGGNYVTNLRQLVEDELQRDLNSDSELRKQLYSKLYTEAVFFDTIEELVEELQPPLSPIGGHPPLSGGHTFFPSKVQNLTKLEKKGLPDKGGVPTSRDGGFVSSIQTLIVGHSVDTTSLRNFVSLCTRSRETRKRKGNGENRLANLVIRRYMSSVGDEFFISFEDELGYLFGFTRILLPRAGETIDYPGLGENTALIRELHVYGQLAKIDENNDNDKTQHQGFGKKLMETAEIIAKSLGYQKLSVISGVGVKQYYEKIGYHREGTYVVKEL